MSNRPSSEAVAQVQLRLDNLAHVLNHRTESAARRYRSHLIVGTVLLLVVSISFTALTNAALEFDANALTQIGRQEVEKHLPAGRASLADYLGNEAPLVVHRTLRSLVELLPQLRMLFLAQLDDALEQLTVDAQKELVVAMEKSIKTAQVNLESVPGLNDREKIEKLVSVIAADFKKNVKTALDALYPDYVAEINRVQSFLVDMNGKDASELTQRERLQREMIRTLLQIIVAEKSKERQGN